MSGDLMDGAISPGRYSLARLSAAELYLVHRFAQSANLRLPRCSAIVLSRLGNGWFYLASGNRQLSC